MLKPVALSLSLALGFGHVPLVAAGEYYRAILSGHDCVALLRLCKTLHAKQNSQTASRRGVNSTELRSWRMAEEMLYGEFGFALGLPPAQVRDYLREKLGG